MGTIMNEKKVSQHESASDLHYSIDQVIGVILGGGFGRRLYPLTRDRSKPAVPFAGNYRIIDIPISNCINSGINRVYVLTQFNSASLNRHINHTYKFDIFRRGFVDVLASEETLDHKGKEFPHGTADAVRKAMRHIRENRNAHFVLVLAGDQLYKLRFEEFLKCQLESDSAGVIGVIPVKESEVFQFGVVKMDESGRIIDFIEKPQNPDEIKGWEYKGFESDEKMYLASMNMYLFRLKLIDEFLSLNPNFLDFGKDVIPKLIKEQRIHGYVYNDYWKDIGTLKNFHEANLSLVHKNPAFNLYEQFYPFYTKPRFLPPSMIKNTKIEDALLSDGIVISKCTIIKSVIGVRSVIRKGTHIENSVILGNDYYETDSVINDTPDKSIPPLGIGKNCIIKNAIIDKNCRIGNNVKLIHNTTSKNAVHKKNYTIADGLIVIPKDTILPDGTVI